jgi:hypothetical protein
MRTKLLMIAGLALAISGSFASAQEEWEERGGEYMRALRMDCENGDEQDCERLRHIQALRRDCENGDEEDCERLRHIWHEWREHRRWREHEDEHVDERGGAAPLVADPKVATCVAIENNYNNCIRHQHDGCPAWVVELKANHCF